MQSFTRNSSGLWAVDNPIAGADAKLNDNFLEPGTVWVHRMATAGAGTLGSPWTGWDTAITWTGNVRYKFCNGYFAFSTQPTWNTINYLWLEGSAFTVLRWTGGSTDAVINQDASGIPVVGGSYFHHIENFFLDGGGTAKNLILNVAAHRSYYRNISGANSTETSMRLTGPSYSIVENCRFIDQEAAWGGTPPVPITTWPLKGVVIDKNGSYGATQLQFIYLQVSNNSSVNGNTPPNGSKGVEITGCDTAHFIGGDFEGTGTALTIDSTSSMCTFDTVDMEASANAISVAGQRCAFRRCNIQGNFTITSDARGTVIEGGWFNTFTNNGLATMILSPYRALSVAGSGTQVELSDKDFFLPLYSDVNGVHVDAKASGVLNFGGGSRIDAYMPFRALSYFWCEGAVKIVNQADPAILADSNDVDIYVHNGKLIFKYQDAGTPRYKYLDMTGTGVTWVHSLTAP